MLPSHTLPNAFPTESQEAAQGQACPDNQVMSEEMFSSWSKIHIALELREHL